MNSYAARPETRHLLLWKKQLYLLWGCYVARRPAHHDGLSKLVDAIEGHDGLCKLVDAIERHVNVYLRHRVGSEEQKPDECVVQMFEDTVALDSAAA